MRADREQVLVRLRKVEGQIRGLQAMVEQDRYCLDILTQLSAARAALDKVGMQILDGHARGCLAAAVKSGDSDQAIDELMQVLERFLK
jgi:DNA-binding FrmR family transcriptional regulator